MTNSPLIHPVILSGGAGTRLWPLSRQDYPKQLLPLAGPRSMISETILRVTDAHRFARPWIVTSDALRFAVAEDMRLNGLDAAIVLEPCARNTAPAIAAAAMLVAEQDPEALLLVMPSDHVIGDKAAFLSCVAHGAEAAAGGYLVTFAMTPTRPETGYGYIRAGTPLDATGTVCRIQSFVEKPDLARAQTFLDEGGYYWNSGMFLFKAKAFLDELSQHAPAIPQAVSESVRQRGIDLDFIRLGAEAFAASPSQSVDYAVMEHTTMAATVIGDMGWTDVGSWSELWAIGEKDAAGNVLHGDVLALDTTGSYVRSEGALVAMLGVKDLTVIATDDAILVADRHRAQDVKRLVDALKAEGRSEHAAHTRVHRPWGYYQTVHAGDRFQVKRLTVNPGARISLQKHAQRAEHWVVVGGTALVTRGEKTEIVRENESVYIPIGTIHRLENPGTEPLSLIEVQSGQYLGEDDIVRIDDSYGRH